MGFVLIFIGTLMWSLDTLIRYPLLSQVPSVIVVFLEHFYLVLIFGTYFVFKNFFSTQTQKLPQSFGQSLKNDIFSFFVVGGFGSAISTLSFTQAFALINPTVVILLQKLQPLIIIFFSVLILKEKLEKRFYFFALIALTGAFLIGYPDLKEFNWGQLFYSLNDPSGVKSLNSFGNLGQVFWGYFLTLLAVLGWSLSTVFGKKLSEKGYSESQIMSGRFLAGFLVMIFFIFYFLIERQITFPQVLQLSSEMDAFYLVHLKILSMVTLSGLLGMYFYYKGLKRVPAHIGAIAELFFPLSVVIINWLFLGKALTLVQIAGSLMLVTSAISVSKNKK